MPETMTEPIVEAPSQAPMCPCGKLMGFQENEKSWRCLACNPIPMNTPICATQKCKRPLTKLGPPQNCWRCLVCNPIVEVKPTERRKKEYVDVTMTEKMVREIIKEEFQSVDEEKIREIIQDEMADWHIQKPPVTAKEVIALLSDTELAKLRKGDEIVEATGAGGETRVFKVGDGIDKVVTIKSETWLQKAKRLGVRTHNEGTGGMRKKVEIVADMERLGEPSEEAGDGL